MSHRPIRARPCAAHHGSSLGRIVVEFGRKAFANRDVALGDAYPVTLYAMGVFESFPGLPINLGLAELAGPKLLSGIAEQSGGRAFPAANLDALPGIATRIGIELRNQYVLAYSPSKSDHDGKYRKLEVKLTAPPGITSLKARWRLGYYAPEE